MKNVFDGPINRMGKVKRRISELKDMIEETSKLNLKEEK